MNSRTEQIFSELSALVNRASGIDISKIDPNENFFGLGLDSLMIVRIGRGLEKDFNVEMKISQFYEEADTLNKLADYLDRNLPAEWTAVSPEPEIEKETPAVPTETQPAFESFMATPAPAGSDGSLHRILSMQLQAMQGLMSRQLDLLKGNGNKPGARQIPQTASPAAAPSKKTENDAESVSVSRKLRSMHFEPESLTDKQREFVAGLVERITARTKNSKVSAEKCRPVLSDWISSLEFRLTLKEIRYPFTAARSEGSKIWDIDGNEYVDLAMGYGVNFLGNRPPFIVEAVEEQLKKGFELGPQSAIAGKAAELIHEMTGADRVAFCNTGSEAVMFALRVARGTTGRDKVVIFSGSYHGNYDGVLAEPGDDGTIPSTPGVAGGAVENIMILNYGVGESLEIIKSHAHELAAVLVEPVQSRRPGFQPREFLHELRKITLEHGVVLIFDEMVTGFRINPGGAQAHFGVKADVVTYGKVVGGGLPIGVVAGKSEYMDAIDGGMWQFGDQSCPKKEVVFFAGTFCKHPLSMAAAHAALSYIKNEGPGLQDRVNERTAYFARTLNAFFEEEKVPIRIAHFGSVFRFESFGKYHLLLEPIEMNLLFHLLMEKGVYTWERHICFFSIAHTDEDVEHIIRAVKESIRELRKGGFSFEDSESAKKTGTVTYPMSSAQARLYVLDELEGGKSSYQLTAGMLIKGDPDIGRLKSAFGEIVRRHDILRTGFMMENGELVQKVYETVDFRVKEIKGGDKSIDDLVRDFTKPFDLARAPVFRVCLAKLSPALRPEPDCKHLLLFGSHHIAIDGLSWNVMVPEAVRLYEGDTLPPLQKQYKDSVKWYEEFSRSDRMKEHGTYWLEKFSGEIPVLNLPTDFPRPLERSPEGGIVYDRISAAETDRLKALARSAEVTLNMLLMTAYYVLLHRLTGQEDIIVGTPVAGRPPGEFERMMGMFANTMVARNRPKSDERFTDFLERVKKSSLEDYDHQDYPLELLVDNLQLKRDTSRNALVDTMFVYEKADARLFKTKDVSFVPYPVKLETSMCDFDLEAIEQEGALNLTMGYTSDLFTRETVERWMGYFRNIVREILGDPNQKLGDIDMLPPEEKRLLLTEFNDTRAETPEHETIVDMFKARAEENPDRIAVVFEDVSMTYRQLDDLSDRIAACLKQVHGIRPEDRVGLFLDRSEQMITGTLGIMKSCGAYVPIDVLYPPDRIAHILENSGCKAILTERKLFETAESFSVGIPVIDIRKPEGGNGVPGPGPSGENLAYVIYTSGSTGKPKGVMVEHHSLANAAMGYRKCYDLDAFDGDIRLLQLASLSFDVFAADFMRALTTGGRIIVCPTAVRLDLPALYNLIAEHRVNIFDSTPALVIPFMEYIHENNLDIGFMKLLAIGSDSLQARHYRTICERFGSGMRILNTFGITEATIESCCFEDRFGNQEFSAITPIGPPIFPNTRLYILDSERRLLPLGATGELYIGGAGLARGYADNDAMTAERFLPDPFNPGERLYKTGDNARWLPDGTLEFLGRADNQVQIRGYRVELEEIEKRLTEHPLVKDAVVLAHDTDDSGKELAAWFVPVDKDADIGVAELRDYLGGFLPDYMIPARFTAMDEFPLTPNAKIDRNALPSPEKSCLSLSAEFKAPRNEIEKGLAAVWETVLNREKIGVHDDFFELGGNSIKAIRLTARIQTDLEMPFMLQDIFSAPTIASLAETIGLREKSGGRLMTEPIPALPERPFYDVSNAQKRLWLIDQMEENSVIYNMHIAFRLEGWLDAEKMDRATRAFAERHEAFRTVFVTVDGEPKQKILRETEHGIETMDLTRERNPEEKAVEIYRADADTPFDLEKGPLFRIKLMRLPDRNGTPEYVLFFNIHHIIFDAWTHDILFGDISAFYRAVSKGTEPELPELRIQYKDYSAWMNGLLARDALKIHRDYWVDRFSDRPAPLDLPLDFPRPELQRFRGSLERIPIDRELTDRLSDISRKSGTTLTMLLVASVNVLLFSLTSREDIVVGLPAAGRIHPDLENQVGFYLNMLPIRTGLDGKDSFETLLANVRQTFTETYTHEIYPYDALVEDLNLPKDTSRNHLFDVIVNVIDFESSPFDIEGVGISPFLEESMTSRSDLDFIFERSDEMDLVVEYDTDLFKPETIREFGSHMIAIFTAIAGNMQTTLNEIRAMFVSEHEKLEQESFLQSTMDIGEDF